MLAAGVGAVGQLAAVGLLASSAWLIATASLRPPVLTLTVAIAAVQCWSLLRGVARYGERLAGHDLALRVLARLRVRAFSALAPLVPARWPGARRGDLLARFVADVDGVQDLYVRAALPLLSGAAAAAVTVAAAAALDPAAGLALGIGLAGAVVTAPALAAVGGRDGCQLAACRGERDALVVEVLHGVTDLAMLGALPGQLARLDRAERLLGRQARRASVAASLGAVLGAGLGGALAAVAVAVSLPALHQGRISGVTVVVLGFLGLAGAETVGELPASFAAAGTALAGARRIAALGDPGRADGTDDADRYPDQASTPPPGAAATAVRRPPEVELDRVVVAYDDRAPVLDHVTLRLRPGEHLALVGPSGAGKTTLGHLLLGFVTPADGRVALDGRPPGQARQLVAWAPQDPHVFHAGVAANLRLARPSATDADLAAVLDAVGLGRWLAGLPEGLATVLGERGTTISGGERQRLGVARALLADRPLLVLDEPTAHLDEANAARLRDAVLAAAEGRSLVWITHRTADLDRFDRVAALEGGRLREAVSPWGRAQRVRTTFTAPVSEARWKVS